MSKLEKFAIDVTADYVNLPEDNIKKFISVEEKEGNFGFDITILISLLIPIISTLIQKCMEKKDENKFIDDLRKPTLLNKARFGILTRRHLAETGARRWKYSTIGIVNSAQKKLSEISDEEVKEIIKEVREPNEPNWWLI